MILKTENYKHYIDTFNKQDEFEGNVGILNENAWSYLENKMPLFDCPDNEFLLTYYFRFWTYRKHIHNVPGGRIVTEFLPAVSWAGKYNSIVMAAPFHLDEGRWLRGETLCDEYINFWYGEEASTTDYSNALPAAALDVCRVTGKTEKLLQLYDKIKEKLEIWEKGFDWDYGEWDRERYWGVSHVGLRENGLFYTVDDLEGSEYSAGKNGYRPLLNSCMHGSYKAMAEMAELLGRNDDVNLYVEKAKKLKELVLKNLWNPDENFFTVLSEDGKHSDARELYGYTPWIYGIAEKENEKAWLALREFGGFIASVATPFLATSHKDFAIRYEGHSCQWNGPSWPLGTSFMLKSLIAYLQNETEHCVDKTDFFRYLSQYVRSQRTVNAEGEIIPWIDENQNPFTGDWIAKTIIEKEGCLYRGKDYNHSSMNDLIITGLCGLKPSLDNVLEIEPLLPDGVWDYFCLDKVRYHEHDLTIMYDKDGSKYGKGKGLKVFVDGEEKGAVENLGALTITLN